MIVKVQLPLSTTLDQPEALIYNKDRSVLIQVPVTPELIARMTLDGDLEIKLFFEAHIEGKKLVLDDYAKWQEW